jgi:hypothetical protein
MVPIGKPCKYYAQVLTADRPQEVHCIANVDDVNTVVIAGLPGRDTTQ